MAVQAAVAGVVATSMEVSRPVVVAVVVMWREGSLPPLSFHSVTKNESHSLPAHSHTVVKEVTSALLFGVPVHAALRGEVGTGGRNTSWGADALATRWRSPNRQADAN